LVGTSLAGTSLAGSSPLDTLFSGVLHGGGTFYARVVVLTILGAVVFFPVTPLLLYLSRRQEREADAAAVRLTGRSGPMIRSIAKLARDNLSGLHPHPLYVAFRFTHPPALERVRALEEEPGSG
ncbi:MAG: M48 family metalloprotease, partial [Thermodesulfobacteriota bacterium]